MLLDDQGKYTEQSEQKLKTISELSPDPRRSEQGLCRIKRPAGIVRYQVRQQYLDSAIASCRRCRTTIGRGVQEMMTNTLSLQQAYKAKVQELIAIQDKEMQRAGVR
jgi:methyl-accepting chemotaxis protein-2 (aspartate sensor receptor)